MKRHSNMHQVDRVVRLIVGLVCVYIGFVDMQLISNRVVAVLVGVFGVVNLWAFFTSRCPVYTAAGFSTAAKLEESTEK